MTTVKPDTSFENYQTPRCQNLYAKLKYFVVENPLPLIFLSGFIVFIFGIVGFTDYYLHSPEYQVGFSDIVYQTIQMFALNSSVLVEKPPLLLHIARFGAALFVVLALTSLILHFFWNQILSLWLWFSRQPKAIICGLGYLGPWYVREFRKRGYRTIIIEKDPLHASLQPIQGYDSFLIKGDAADPAILKQIHLRNHDAMVLVTGDDLTNIRSAMAIHKLMNSGKKDTDTFPGTVSEKTKKPIYLLHILDRWLDNALRFRFDPVYQGNPPNLFHFNMYTKAAEKLVPFICNDIIFKKPGHEGIQNIHILLIGVGTMGEEIIKQFIEIWEKYITNPSSQSAVLTITIIDYKEARDKADRLRLWMKENKYHSENSKIRDFPYKVPSADFIGGDFLKKNNPNEPPIPPISAVIICLANPTLAMTTALEIVPVITKHQIPVTDSPQNTPPVYIRFIRNDEITHFISILKKQEAFSKFIPYTVAEYGGFWNEEFEKRFPEKPCKFLKICPFQCKKETINP